MAPEDNVQHSFETDIVSNNKDDNDDVPVQQDMIDGVMNWDTDIKTVLILVGTLVYTTKRESLFFAHYTEMEC